MQGHIEWGHSLQLVIVCPAAIQDQMKMNLHAKPKTYYVVSVLRDLQLILFLIPSHRGIPGNDRVDQFAI